MAKRAIIVENSDALAALLEQSFEERGVKTYHCKNPFEALAKLRVFASTDTFCDMLVAPPASLSPESAKLIRWVVKHSPRTKIISISPKDNASKNKPEETNAPLNYTKEHLKQHRDYLRRQDLISQGKRLRMARIMAIVSGEASGNVKLDKLKSDNAYSNQKLAEWMETIFIGESKGLRRMAWKELQIKAKRSKIEVSLWDLKRRWKVWKRNKLWGGK